jgi:hypothetical protein
MNLCKPRIRFTADQAVSCFDARVDMRHFLGKIGMFNVAKPVAGECRRLYRRVVNIRFCVATEDIMKK